MSIFKHKKNDTNSFFYYMQIQTAIAHIKMILLLFTR